MNLLEVGLDKTPDENMLSYNNFVKEIDNGICRLSYKDKQYKVLGVAFVKSQLRVILDLDDYI
jgi:hypothetical protein